MELIGERAREKDTISLYRIFEQRINNACCTLQHPSSLLRNMFAKRWLIWTKWIGYDARDIMKVILTLCIHEKEDEEEEWLAVSFGNVAFCNQRTVYTNITPTESEINPKHVRTVCKRTRDNRLTVKEPFLINC